MLKSAAKSRSFRAFNLSNDIGGIYWWERSMKNTLTFLLSPTRAQSLRENIGVVTGLSKEIAWKRLIAETIVFTKMRANSRRGEVFSFLSDG